MMSPRVGKAHGSCRARPAQVTDLKPDLTSCADAACGILVDTKSWFVAPRRYMTDVFISYAREDEARVRDIVRALEQQNWSVFWDRRIPAGKSWRSYIGQALADAKCVIVVWSQWS